MKKIREIFTYLMIYRSVSNGFDVSGAKQWLEKMLRVMKKTKKYSLTQKIKAFRKGYTPQLAEKLEIDLNSQRDIRENISLRDYLYLQPLNGLYTKWMDNKVITRKICADFADVFQNVYYQVTSSKNGNSITALEDCPYEGYGEEDVIRLIRDKKRVAVTEPRRYRNVLIEYIDGAYYYDHQLIDESEIISKITSFHKRAIIAEYAVPADEYRNRYNDFGNLITAVIVNKTGNSPVITEAFVRVDDHYTDELNKNRERETVLENKIYYNTDTLDKADKEKLPAQKYYSGSIVPVDPQNGVYDDAACSGSISSWDEIRDTVVKICRHVPQLEFFSMDILITEDGFKIIPFMNVPQYFEHKKFSAETLDYLLGKLKEKKEYYSDPKVKKAWSREKVITKIRMIFCRMFFPKGLKPYLSTRWISEVKDDLLRNKETTIKEKIWAYRHGFLSYRLKQYGITDENFCDYISDFEYKWLRHINGSYRSVLEDKITVKYIVNKFRECFPDYYYHIKTVNNVNVIIPMMDCPEGYGHDFEDIFALVRAKGVLALKPDFGSHGAGFYKLSYADGEYYLNFDRVEKQQVTDILSDPANQYLITEYINNHPQFKRIYDGAVNTIRIIVFKKDGITPEIGNAYMRFGSNKTGAVDNMGAGGMFVQVDIDTGNYHSAKIITDNSIKDCPRHPDTDVLMEGTIPHWDGVKETVLKVAASIPQLEYFGFDVAVTEEGIKFPEINRSPDYPKIERFSYATNQYLLQKLQEKKKKFGYDKKPCRTLIHLPRR